MRRRAIDYRSSKTSSHSYRRAVARAFGAAVVLAGVCGVRAEPPTLNVGSAFGTIYPPDVWVPISIDIKNPESKPFEGVLRIPLRGVDGSPADGPAVIEQPVYVPAHARVKLPGAIYLNDFSAPPGKEKDKNRVVPDVAIATLHTISGQEVARTPLVGRSVSQMSSEYPSNGAVIVSIGPVLESHSSASYEVDGMAEALQYASGVGYQTRILDPKDVPAHAVALASVTAIVFDAAPSDLDPAQRTTLVDWVRAGGVMIVSAPDVSYGAVGTWLEPLMPVDVIGRRLASELPVGSSPGPWFTPETSRSKPAPDADSDEEVEKPASKKPAAPVKPTPPNTGAKGSGQAKGVGAVKAPEKPTPVERSPQMPRDLTSPIPFGAPVEIVEAIEPLDASGVTVLIGDASYVQVAYRQVGLGRVVFTSFPAGAPDVYDARTGQLWKAIIGPARPGAVGAVPTQPLSTTQLPANLPTVLSSLVGATSAPWSVAAGVGGGYLLLVVVAQLTLGGAKRPQAFAISVGGAVVLAGTLLVLGQVRQSGQPFVSASLSVVDVATDGGGTRQDSAILFGRDPGDVELTAGPGIQSMRTTEGATQEVPVLRLQPIGVKLPPRSVSTESIGRLIRAEGTVPPSFKLSAVGTFGPDGLSVSIDNGTGTPLDSPLVIWNQTSFNLPGLAQGTSTQPVGSSNQNPRGSFAGRSVFTSEQDRLRGDVLRWLGRVASTDTVSVAPPDPKPYLAAWGTDATVPPALVIQPPVDKTRGQALLRVPLQIKAPTSGSKVRVEAAFNKLVIGPTPVSIYNAATRQWLSSNQDGSFLLGFEAPKALGKLSVTRATIVGDLNAPRQTVTVLGGQVRNGKPTDNSTGRVLATWSSPVTPQSVSFDVAPDDIDPAGRVWVRVDVQNPPADGSSVAWQMFELGASFDDATVQ